jgi:hypothetical protein
MSDASRVQRIAFKGRRAPARTEEIRQAVRSFFDKLPFLGAVSYDVEFVWFSEFPGDPWFWSLRVMPRDGGAEIPPLFVQELADEVRGLFENDLRVG